MLGIKYAEEDYFHNEENIASNNADYFFPFDVRVFFKRIVVN